MITTPLPQARRLLSLIIPLGLALVTTNPAQATSLNLPSLQELTPRLELKSQLLERRFQLVLSRHAVALRKAEARCEAGERSACKLAKWQAFLIDVSSAPLSDQLYQVNAYVNQVRYRSDQRNWQRADFWADPEQFFDRGGDCEDYAIAKYVALRAIGIPAEQLRIVVVYDRKTLADHAILAIAAPDGVKVLDSNHKRVIDWEESNQRYSPYYSLNEQAVWIHSSKT
jgi:predicted transglutaminase-like cysteine proteinase